MGYLQWFVELWKLYTVLYEKGEILGSIKKWNSVTMEEIYIVNATLGLWGMPWLKHNDLELLLLLIKVCLTHLKLYPGMGSSSISTGHHA